MELFLLTTAIGAATLIHWVNNLNKDIQEEIEYQQWNKEMHNLWSVEE